MEALLLELLQHRALLPEFVRDPSYAERDELLLKRPLRVLNDSLAGREFLVGENFTVADLNVASLLAWGKMGRLDLSIHSNVTRWLDGCLSLRLRAGARSDQAQPRSLTNCNSASDACIVHHNKIASSTLRNVRFTPESRHSLSRPACPLRRAGAIRSFGQPA
jgi:hypothetical protein